MRLAKLVGMVVLSLTVFGLCYSLGSRRAMAQVTAPPKDDGYISSDHKCEEWSCGASMFNINTLSRLGLIRSQGWITAVLAFLFTAWSVSPVRADALVDEVRKRNRAAVESIHSLSCRYSTAMVKADGTTMPDDTPTGRYWRSGSAYRFKWESGKRSGDVLVKDGRADGLFQSPDPKGVPRRRGSVGIGDGLAGPHADPWLKSMFTFLGDTKKPGHYTFDELLSLPSPPKIDSCERRREGGGDLVVVKARWPDSTTDFRFDPSVNYLIRKMIVKVPGQRTNEYATEVQRFREPAPGIFFPEQVRVVSSSNGRPVATETFTFTDIVVNRPIAASFFEMTFPAGTSVDDQLKGTSYVVGGIGEPTGEERRISKPPPPARPVASARTETKEEPRSWSWVILPASLGVLLLAGVVLGVRRWRSDA